MISVIGCEVLYAQVIFGSSCGKSYRLLRCAPGRLEVHRRSCLGAARLGAGKGILQRRVMRWLPFPPDNALRGAENLRVELWGPFLTVSGTRKGGAMGMRDPARQSTGGKGVVLRREMNYGFFSASWRLPVSTLVTLLQTNPARVSCEGPEVLCGADPKCRVLDTP